MSKIAEIHDGVQGGYIEIHEVSLNPSAIAADSQGTEDVTESGLTTSDKVLAFDPIQLNAGLAPIGVRVKATDTLEFTLQNTTEAEVTGTAKTWRLTILKAA